MQLLYCLNSVVIATHDSAQNVPVSLYPAGTFIIPYDQPLSTLNRVGTAPPAPPRGVAFVADTRPYAQPTETPAILLNYAAQVRFNKSTKGITYNGNPYHTDRVSQTLIGNLAIYAQTLAPTATIDFTQDNAHYSITAADAIAINKQVSALIQQCRTIEAACIADLNSPTPTIKLYADIDTRFAGV
jgi:hypothetical protein